MTAPGRRSPELAAQAAPPARSLIGRPRFVGLLLRRCQPLIGGVREQVPLPGAGRGGQGALP